MPRQFSRGFSRQITTVNFKLTLSICDEKVVQNFVKSQEVKLHFETKVYNSHLEETPTY